MDNTQSKMKSAFKLACMCIMAALAAVQMHADEYLLYWAVADTAVVDSTPLDSYVSQYAQANNDFNIGGHSGKIAGARAVLYEIGDDDDVTEPTLLNLYYYSIDSQEQIWYGTSFTDTVIADDDGHVVGTGTGMYSYFATSSPTELAFAIELGNWESGEWVTLASSSMMSYNDLTVRDVDGIHIMQMSDMNSLANFQPWMPAAYAVPEPSAGVLMLLGLASIALMRKPFKRS